MFKNKRIKRSVLVAAVVVGILSLSVVAYAAVPGIWRYFDTRVIQGEEFVQDFWVGETDLPDGTTSVGSHIDIDREALEAAGGGAVIVEVDGEKWVVLDELHLDNIEDGLALLQLENPLLPSFLPEGFALGRFTFPVNPNNHQYMMGTIRAAMHAIVDYTNGDSTIQLRMMQMVYRPGAAVGVAAAEGQQALVVNGNKVVITYGSLTAAEIARLDGVELYDSSTNWDEYTTSIMVAAAADAPDIEMGLVMIVDGVGYAIRGEGVSLYELVRMAASME